MAIASFSSSFPLDVERIIMEMAAHDDKQMALELVLVAKRIQAWWAIFYSTAIFMNYIYRVEPIIYRRIYVDETKGHRLMESINTSPKPLSFYHDTIKRIHFDYSPAPIFDLKSTTEPKEHILPNIYEALLPRCLGVTHIVSSYHPWEHIPQLARLFAEIHPERVSGFLHDLLNPGHPDFTAPFFSRITHLIIQDPSWYYWSGFDRLSHLTHISIPPFPFRKEITTDRFRVLVNTGITRILSQCQKLQVLLIHRSDWSWSEPGNYLDVDDSRIVIFQKDHASMFRDWNLC